jgi:hypothetical protein
MRHTGVVVASLVLLAATVANAQEPVWSFRVGGGVLIGQERSTVIDPATTVTLGRKVPIVSLDLARQLDCCLEMFISALIPQVGVELTGGGTTQKAESVSPSGFHIGVHYRLHKREQGATPWRHGPYVSGFLTGYTRDRSGVVSLPAVGASGSNREAVFQFAGGLGWGVGGGYRYRFSDQFRLDVNVKWDHFHVNVGERHKLDWNPLLISGGLIIRLY